MALPHDKGNPLEHTHISHKAHSRLFEAKPGIFRTQSKVAGRGQVQSAPDAVTVDGGNYRLFAPFYAADGILEFFDLGQESPLDRALLVRFHYFGNFRHHPHEIDTR